MDLLADTHIHLYPAHNPAALIDGSVARLRRAANAPDAPCALFLTEGRGFNAFTALQNGSLTLPASHRIEPASEPEALWIHNGPNRTLLLAGRQIVAAERVELLALTLLAPPEDGRPAAEIIHSVEAANAIPVLAWSPGKWMFSRAKTVDTLTRTHPGLRLGDSSLRSLGWPLPAPMARATLPVLAGSDPLPFPGDESQAGTFGIRISLTLDERTPVTSLRNALRNPDTPVTPIGRRNPPHRMALRMIRHRRHKSS